MPDTYWDLFFGYTAFWLIVFGFVISIRCETSKIRVRLEEMSRRPGASQ